MPRHVALIPRPLEPRAARLLSSVVEITLDLHGYEGVKALLESTAGRTCLAALAGESRPHHARAFVDAALRRGLDEERLGLLLVGDSATSDSGSDNPPHAVTDRALVDDDATILQLPTAHARLQLPKKSAAKRRAQNSDRDANVAEVVALHRSAPSVDGAVLAALKMVAQSPQLAPFDRLARMPGVGSRALFAIGCASLIVQSPHAPPDPHLISYALGSLDGTPHPVPLKVYDVVVTTLERLLHERGVPSQKPRAGALLTLAELIRLRAAHAAPLSPASFSRRERAHALDYVALVRDGVVKDGAVIPRVPRRPSRTIRRSPEVWHVVKGVPLTHEVQVDLFAP